MVSTKHRPQTTPGEITRILADKGNPESLRSVIQFAYDELHRIAGGYSRKSRGRTWQPTALLNQACLRFLEDEAKARARGTTFKNRRHFFGAASKAMCRVLVDEARKRNARKRGRGWTRADFVEAERIGFEHPKEILDLNIALERLREERPELAEIVQLRIFAGLTIQEIAFIVGISVSTARRRWKEALRHLAELLKSLEGGLPA